MVRVAVTVIAVSVSLITVAHGQRAKPSAGLVGCWRTEDVASKNSADLCLGLAGNATTGWFNSQEHEAVYQGRRYATKGNQLTIYDHRADHDPNPHGNVCKFALPFDGSELILRDCEYKGDWKRVCRDVKLDEQGSVVCVKYPAN